MTYAVFPPRGFGAAGRAGRPRIFVSPTLLCAAALALSTLAALWFLHGSPFATRPGARLPSAANAAKGPSRPGDAGPPTPAYTPILFARIASLRASFEQLRPRVSTPPAPTPVPAPVETFVASPSPAPLPAEQSGADQTVPLPVPRPTGLLPANIPAPGTAGIAQPDEKTSPQPVPPGPQGFIEKLFGAGAPSGAAPPPAPALAYAAPENGEFHNILKDLFGRPSSPYDRWTAVYDIAAHTVYLPDGTKLEAHSGVGARLDDPRGVAERMRGATPPNLYELEVREKPFHGVRALRLNPVGKGTTYGRAGLLAHTYMLGPRGDSNGCVVFKNYQAFLQAYDTGAIKRLAVVERAN
jgi:hypothetical protein